MRAIQTIKPIWLLVFLLAGAFLPLVGAAQPGYGSYGRDPYGYNQSYGERYGDFYDDLAPYGQWMDHPDYGPVWIPDVDRNFQPYATNGHWVITEYGNTWVSDYAWGWAPFHYGRWFYDNFYGWSWVPGTEWGPAWVSWRSGGGYYGWAPMGPGININVNFNIPARYWVFVPQVYITSPRLYSYCVPRPQVINVYNNTTIINNVYRYNNRAYVYGPHRNEIEYVTRSRVPVYRIDNMNRPGRAVIRDGYVGIYRPEIRNNGNSRANRRYNDYPAYGSTRPDNRGNYNNRYPDASGRSSRSYPDNYGNNRGRSQVEESPAPYSNNNGSYNRQNSRGQYTQPEVAQPSENRSSPFEGVRPESPRYPDQYEGNRDRRGRSESAPMNQQGQVETARPRFPNGGFPQPEQRNDNADRQMPAGGNFPGRRGAEMNQSQTRPEVHIQRDRFESPAQQPSAAPAEQPSGGGRFGRRGPN